MTKTFRSGEYRTGGEYHREIDKNWKYYPIYLAKMQFIEKYFAKISKNAEMLDVGSGEGVLVEKFRELGYNIIGVDLNYASKYVIKGDMTKLPFKNETFGYILCLDVIEHLNFEEQKKALSEIKRALKKNGELILSVPNLAHFASRISFLFTGKLIRTSKIERHKGDRPIGEYLTMLNELNFTIVERKGIFPTFPLSSLLTYLFPSRVLFLHKILNMFFSYPNLCFLNIIICKKR
jgi:2-polyprenyl-3-methyl-5-hydroxy-6-metoxy-1,4-benzoquinol methylase